MTDLDYGARHRGEERGLASRLAGAAAAVSIIVLSGCSSPTYGTGKPADQQLLQDVTGILSIGPKDKEAIDYSPRPAIVKPPSTEVLPPPQEDVAAISPAWPESPEQRLARVRAEATANQDNPFYRTNVVRDTSVESSGPALDTTPGPVRADGDSINSGILGASTRTQRAAFLQRKQEAQSSPTTRRYLSEPPLEYRQPVPTAPAGDLGTDEEKKERAAKRGAKGGDSGLRKLLPW